MEQLPEELVGCILSFLPYRERQLCRQVSHSWHQVVVSVEQLRSASDSVSAAEGEGDGHHHHPQRQLTHVQKAIREGDLSLVRKWLATKPTIQSKPDEEERDEEADEFPTDDVEWHVLAYACKHCRNPAIVEAIVAYAPDLLEKAIPGGIISHYPVLSNIKHECDVLEANSEAVKRVSGGLHGLHVAACFGTPAIIKALLRAGAQIEQGVYACRLRGMTPLHIAVRCWKKNPVHAIHNVQTLVDAGANILAGVVDGGKSPLHSAMEMAAPAEIVKLLLPGAHGAACDYKGGPFYCFSDALPIHLAMKNAAISLEAVKVLVESAPDTANKPVRAYNTSYYPTPLHLACVFIPHRADLIEWLVTSGLVDVNAKLKGEGEGVRPFVVGDTAVHMLARQDKLTDHLLQVFTAAGAKLDITNVKGETLQTVQRK